MIVSEYFVHFIFFSFCGWLWETIFCTINSKHFENRGFLFGPICPIYGSCVVIVEILFRNINMISSPDTPLWGIFLICAVGSAIAEYSTSFYLEKRFHARWWDYSNIPLNINGRIALPISACFGIAGVVIIKYILPFIYSNVSSVPPLVYEILSLLLAAVFGADFALTEASLNDLLVRIQGAEKEFVERAETAYMTLASTPQQIEDKLREYEDEFRLRASAAAAGLSWRQKYIFDNIKKFNPAKTAADYQFSAGQRIKEALSEIEKRMRTESDDQDLQL